MPNTALTRLNIAAAPTSAIIRYNGVTIGDGADSQYLTTPPQYRLKGAQVYDEADRVVLYTRYTLTLSTLVWAGDALQTTQSNSMLTLREALSEPGKQLTITGIGFGDTTSPGSHNDVAWGTKPRVVSLAPVGGVLAWELIWTVEFNVSECLSNTYGFLLAFNYESSYSIDHEGLTTRHISGYAEIPRTHGDGQPTADRVREKIVVTIPQGFARVRQDFRENKAKNRIDFSIVDQQLDGTAPPPGVSDWDLDYGFSNMAPGFSMWNVTLAGSITMRPGQPPSAAALTYMIVLLDKVQKIRSANDGVGPNRIVTPLQMSVHRKLGSRRTSFSTTFRVAQCLTDLLKNGGLWDPIAGTTYAAWRGSMLDLWGPRGQAGLSSGGGDILVDLCAVNRKSEVQINDHYNGANIADDAAAYVANSLTTANVTEESSWLMYENKLTIVRKEQKVLHRLAQPIDLAIHAVQSAASFAGAGNLLTFVPFAGKPEIVEQQGKPEQYILMEGKAVRLKFPVQKPELKTVDGQPAEPFGEQRFQCVPVTDFFGVPAFAARWQLMYRVDGYVRGVKPKKNPLICTTSDLTDND